MDFDHAPTSYYPNACAVDEGFSRCHVVILAVKDLTQSTLSGRNSELYTVSRNCKKKMELELMELAEVQLKHQLWVVRHELEQLEKEEQLKELEQWSRDLQLEIMELQLEALKKLRPDEIEGQLKKLEQAFLEVHTLAWFVTCESFVPCFP